MDDDLMSLRGSRQPGDDLFGSFSDPDDLGFDLPPVPPAGGSGASRGGSLLDDDSFGAPFDFPDFDQPTVNAQAASAPPPAASAPTVRTPPAKRSAPARAAAAPRKPRRRPAKGMTPQQRMLLSIFLFLDVAVLSALLLLTIGAIQF